MYVLGVVAPPPDRDRLIGRLVEGLGDRGTVAVVERSDGGRAGGSAGATTEYRLSSDGSWTATGGNAELSDLLDRLAPDHDYAVVSGYPDADVPHVVVGERDYDGEVLLAADGADAVDADAAIDALEDTEPYETLESLVARVKRSPAADRAGAIATFTGRVRARDHEDDAPTTHLEFEKYEDVADERMASIGAELEEREGVFAVAMYHRTGVVESGEDIVFVVVLAGHREEAFRTVEDGINRLKAEVPLFKKEVTVEEAFWVHERR